MMMSNTQKRFLLFMLIVLVAVGQMAQTIYVPAMANMAETLNVQRRHAAGDGGLSDDLRRIAADLRAAVRQHWPAAGDPRGHDDFRGGRADRPVCAVAEYAGTGQCGTGIGYRRGWRDGAHHAARSLLRHCAAPANSLLNMGILVSPLLAPVIGALLTHLFGWHACFAFLLLLCVGVTAAMARWLPETRPVDAPATPFLRRYITLLSDGNFVRYLLLLIGALAGIAVFEASCGVLMAGVLGLDGLTVSILFILPIPAAFSVLVCRPRAEIRHTLMWYGVNSCLLAGLLMWLPAWFGVMTIWTLLVPAALFSSAQACCFRWQLLARWSPTRGRQRRCADRRPQNLGSGVVAWLSALLPQHDQSSLGMLMFVTSLVMLLCWWPLSRHPESGKQTVTG